MEISIFSPIFSEICPFPPPTPYLSSFKDSEFTVTLMSLIKEVLGVVYLYFLQPMRTCTSNSLPPIRACVPILLQFSGKMHYNMHEQITNNLKKRKKLHVCLLGM